MHTCVLCDGNLYIQYFDNVLQQVQSKLKLVVKIPYWRQYMDSSHYSRLFSIDDILYVHDNCGSVYVLIDGELKFAKSISGRFYHFCGKSYVWNQNKQLIGRLNPDLSFKTVCKMKNVFELSYQAGGLLVFNDSSKEFSYHVDMFKSESKILPYCEVTGIISDSYQVSGTTLDSEEQMRRNRAEDEFLAIQHKNKQFQNIFALTDRFIFYKTDFQNNFFKTENKFEKTKNSKNIFTEKMKLDEISFLTNKMVQIFVSNQEVDQ
ncbi:Conserved_hypothetical protein [Hexamita inflata]|uniref:Uncharacterized protein n=1 Tax=Hexamita inflata TaxID=28002 RepID=A0AA86ND10_9EUKA|nr:Conserved hypothetical protein [Hexamita inflata]